MTANSIGSSLCHEFEFTTLDANLQHLENIDVPITQKHGIVSSSFAS